MKKLLSTLLLSLSLAAGFAQASPSAPVAGKDFEVMKAPQPVSAPAGEYAIARLFPGNQSRDRGWALERFF